MKYTDWQRGLYEPLFLHFKDKSIKISIEKLQWTQKKVIRTRK